MPGAQHVANVSSFKRVSEFLSDLLMRRPTVCVLGPREGEGAPGEADHVQIMHGVYFCTCGCPQADSARSCTDHASRPGGAPRMDMLIDWKLVRSSMTDGVACTVPWWWLEAVMRELSKARARGWNAWSSSTLQIVLGVSGDVGGASATGRDDGRPTKLAGVVRHDALCAQREWKSGDGLAMMSIKRMTYRKIQCGFWKKA